MVKKVSPVIDTGILSLDLLKRQSGLDYWMAIGHTLPSQSRLQSMRLAAFNGIYSCKSLHRR